MTFTIGQANNALVFPGLGLGTIVARARAVSDGMLLAAADTVAEFVDASPPGAPVMPPVNRVREVSLRVAAAVARAAMDEGLARADVGDASAQVRTATWEPAYRVVRPLTPDAGGVAPR